MILFTGPALLWAASGIMTNTRLMSKVNCTKICTHIAMLARTCVFALDTPMDPHPMYSSCPDVPECGAHWHEYVGPLPTPNSAGVRFLRLPVMVYDGLYPGTDPNISSPPKPRRPVHHYQFKPLDNMPDLRHSCSHHTSPLHSSQAWLLRS
jgi:hypothetical protein